MYQEQKRLQEVNRKYELYFEKINKVSTSRINIDCPIKCGICCYNCGYILDHGCSLSRDQRPTCCNTFLCQDGFDKLKELAC